jgi:EAL and modified HD-GYP domain-containing signal transduction protein
MAPRQPAGGGVTDPAPPVGRPPADLYVARQPILDRAKRTYAYELLFRPGESDRYDGSDGDRASLRVLDASFLSAGIHDITGGKRAFVNFTRETLVSGYASILPRNVVVVEVLESVVPDEEVLEACRLLKDAGHTLALDDFVAGSDAERLVTLADIVKVDFVHTAAAERRRLAQRFLAQGLVLVAEKVETEAEFVEGVELGYHYFQGYFFERPVRVAATTLPAAKLTLLRLLQRVNQPSADFQEIEALIKQEVGLTYKLLAYLNSAAMGRRQRIESVGHALILLGEDGVRKWVSVVALAGLGIDRPFELVVVSVTRARFCETAADAIGVGARAQDAFLLGLFSLLDALLSRPMAEILSTVPLADDARAALSGEDNALRRLLELAIAYERGDWARAAGLARAWPVPETTFAQLHRRAVEEANATTRLVS